LNGRLADMEEFEKVVGARHLNAVKLPTRPEPS